MKEERMKILQMVEEGKISAEEAGKLLDSLKDHWDCVDFCGDEEFNVRMKEFCANTEKFMKNMGGKIGEFAKDMEPRVRNVTKTVVSKTADMVEDLGKALAKCLNSLNEFDEKADNCGCCGENEKKSECCDESREN